MASNPRRKIFPRGAMAFCAAAAMALAIPAARSYAAAWTEAAGEADIITSLRGSIAEDSFDANGHESRSPTFRKQEADVYAEYGLSDQTTLIFHPDFIDFDPNKPSVGAVGFGNTEIGLLQRLWSDDAQVFSVQGTVLFPGRSVLTSGGIDGEARALYGVGFTFAGLPAFLDAELGYRMRSLGYADEVRPELTFGIHADPDWLVLAQSLNVLLTGHGRALLYQGEQEKMQLSAVRRLDENVSLQLGIFATLAGTNTPAERGLLLGLWYHF